MNMDSNEGICSAAQIVCEVFYAGSKVVSLTLHFQIIIHNLLQEIKKESRKKRDERIKSKKEEITEANDSDITVDISLHGRESGMSFYLIHKFNTRTKQAETSQ